MSSTASPDLATVLTAAIGSGLQGVRVALPGRVESYDSTTQSCSVQPLVYDGYNDETGVRQPEKLPVVTSVPVVFPGSGAYSLTWPISKGDTVLLVFASSSIDRWLALGGEVDPIDDRRHHITDAIAIPGLRDFPHATTTTDPSAMVMAAGSLKLGSSAAVDAAVKGTTFATDLNVVMAAVSTFAATCTTTPPTTPANTLAAAVTAFVGQMSAYLSAIVKVG